MVDTRIMSSNKRSLSKKYRTKSVSGSSVQSKNTSGLNQKNLKPGLQDQTEAESASLTDKTPDTPSTPQLDTSHDSDEASSSLLKKVADNPHFPFANDNYKHPFGHSGMDTNTSIGSGSRMPLTEQALQTQNDTNEDSPQGRPSFFQNTSQYRRAIQSGLPLDASNDLRDVDKLEWPNNPQAFELSPGSPDDPQGQDGSISGASSPTPQRNVNNGKRSRRSLRHDSPHTTFVQDVKALADKRFENTSYDDTTRIPSGVISQRARYEKSRSRQKGRKRESDAGTTDNDAHCEQDQEHGKERGHDRNDGQGVDVTKEQHNDLGKDIDPTMSGIEQEPGVSTNDDPIAPHDDVPVVDTGFLNISRDPSPDLWMFDPQLLDYSTSGPVSQPPAHRTRSSAEPGLQGGDEASEDREQEDSIYYSWLPREDGYEGYHHSRLVIQQPSGHLELEPDDPQSEWYLALSIDPSHTHNGSPVNTPTQDSEAVPNALAEQVATLNVQNDTGEGRRDSFAMRELASSVLLPPIPADAVPLNVWPSGVKTSFSDVEDGENFSFVQGLHMSKADKPVFGDISSCLTDYGPLINGQCDGPVRNEAASDHNLHLSAPFLQQDSVEQIVPLNYVKAPDEYERHLLGMDNDQDEQDKDVKGNKKRKAAAEAAEAAQSVESWALSNRMLVEAGGVEGDDTVMQATPPVPPKKKRGRPKKNPLPPAVQPTTATAGLSSARSSGTAGSLQRPAGNHTQNAVNTPEVPASTALPGLGSMPKLTRFHVLDLASQKVIMKRVYNIQRLYIRSELPKAKYWTCKKLGELHNRKNIVLDTMWSSGASDFPGLANAGVQSSGHSMGRAEVNGFAGKSLPTAENVNDNVEDAWSHQPLTWHNQMNPMTDPSRKRTASEERFAEAADRAKKVLTEPSPSSITSPLTDNDPYMCNDLFPTLELENEFGYLENADQDPDTMDTDENVLTTEEVARINQVHDDHSASHARTSEVREDSSDGVMMVDYPSSAGENTTEQKEQLEVPGLEPSSSERPELSLLNSSPPGTSSNTLLPSNMASPRPKHDYKATLQDNQNFLTSCYRQRSTIARHMNRMERRLEESWSRQTADIPQAVTPNPRLIRCTGESKLTKTSMEAFLYALNAEQHLLESLVFHINTRTKELERDQGRAKTYMECLHGGRIAMLHDRGDGR